MPIEHKTKSAKPESAATDDIGSGAWNEAHNAPPIQFVILHDNSSGTIFTNAPAALNETLPVTHRVVADLTFVSQIRAVCNVVAAGTATSEVRVQYSTDSGTTWNYLDGVDGPKLATGSVGIKQTALLTLVAGAKALVWLRAVTINGDGALDPNVRFLHLLLY